MEGICSGNLSAVMWCGVAPSSGWELPRKGQQSSPSSSCRAVALFLLCTCTSWHGQWDVPRERYRDVASLQGKHLLPVAGCLLHLEVMGVCCSQNGLREHLWENVCFVRPLAVLQKPGDFLCTHIFLQDLRQKLLTNSLPLCIPVQKGHE